jgi:hypothetical protein
VTACQLVAVEADFLVVTYLYSPIEEEVYVQPPVELIPEWKGKIMQLKKAM